MDSNIRYVTYGENEKEIIKKGIKVIREVLAGDDPGILKERNLKILN